MTLPRIRVIGCGNPDAGDDAAGLLAVRAAAERLQDRPSIQVVAAGSASKVVDLIHGVEAAVIVDAVRSPAGSRRPGELVRVVVTSDELPNSLGSVVSSHGLGLGDVIRLERALGCSPHIVFLGIEAAEVEVGRAPCSAVTRALGRLVELVEQEALAIERQLQADGGVAIRPTSVAGA